MRLVFVGIACLAADKSAEVKFVVAVSISVSSTYLSPVDVHEKSREFVSVKFFVVPYCLVRRWSGRSV